MKKKIILNLLVFPLVFAFFWYLIPLVIVKFNPTLTQSPLILVTGDFSNPESFGSLVMSGIIESKANLPTNEKIETEKYELLEYTEADLSVGFIVEKTSILNEKIRDDLVTLVAHKNIIGIIAANSSETIEPVLQVGKEFKIPVFLAVASNDEIIAEYNDISFRLLANDGKQAEAISKWCEQIIDSTETDKIGVLYSQTRYGKGLRRTLERVIGINSLIPFSLGTTTDIAGSFNYGERAGVNAWVAITYKEEALEIAVKKKSLGINGPILFSDGAYGKWLTQINEDSIYYTFPLPDTSFKNVGYNHFGYDAYRLIYYAFSKYKHESMKTKDDFLNIINDHEFTFWLKGLNGKYKFNNGENIMSKFEYFKSSYENQ